MRPHHIVNICAGWQRLKPGTRIGYHSGLRHWLKYISARWDTASAIPHVHEPDPPTRTVPDTELDRAVQYADPALALVLLLARDAALRAATAYTLGPEAIDGKVIRAKTKYDQGIVVPMTPRLELLARAAAGRVAPGQPLVLGLGVACAPTAKSIGNVLRHRLESLQKRTGLGDWTWHDLRRTAAQRLYERTGDLRLVQSLMGHKTMLNTLHYLNALRPVLDTSHVAALTTPEGTNPCE